MVTASKMGERKIIGRMIKHFTPMPRVNISFGDDVSGIRLDDGGTLILKTDMLVWETDIPKGMTYFQGARKAVIMNFSDLGSKGVKPLAFLASFGFPKDTLARTIEEIAQGIETGVREYGSYMIGGDTNEACDIIISGMAYGIGEESKLMKRTGAKKGDLLCTTGSFGNTTAALMVLLEGKEVSSGISDLLLKSIYHPNARVKEGIVLSETGAVTSCMDSSDGLAISVHELSLQNGLGFRVDHIPVTDEAGSFAKYHGLDPKELALYGGEEYELVFTVTPSRIEEVRESLKGVRCELIEMGKATGEKSITYHDKGNYKIVKNYGWEHFTD
jgi:thiamine-monophosphate kinase